MKMRVTASKIHLPAFQLEASQAEETRSRQAYADASVTSREERITLKLRYASLLTPTGGKLP